MFYIKIRTPHLECKSLVAKKKKQRRAPPPNSRAAKNRAVRADALRQELKAREYLSQIQRDYDLLHKLLKKIDDAKLGKARKGSSFRDSSPANLILSKCNAQKEVLKAKLDTNFRRLKFCLPELKSMELVDPKGENPFSKFVELMIQATKDNSK